MIAHRLSTISEADKIVVLKDGVVAEEGSHSELLARDGVYAELHRIQYQTAGASPAHAA
jgi:subfamily B ATP-binding cassette protein MsbA